MSSSYFHFGYISILIREVANQAFACESWYTYNLKLVMKIVRQNVPVSSDQYLIIELPIRMCQ